MTKRILLDSRQLEITIWRLCQQLIENHDNFSNSVILGLQPRGIFLADRIQQKLQELMQIEVGLGYLDTTFHRDDFRRRDQPLKARETKVPFLIESKKVILIDDVMFTGRTVRAALDAMTTFGRPQKVELMVLIDRMYSRYIPVAADYIGKRVNTIHSQKVLMDLKEQGGDDKIWIIDGIENE